MGCTGGLSIPYHGPYNFYPTGPETRTQEFFKNHKFFDNRGQIEYKKLHINRGSSHYLNLWNWCFREVSKPAEPSKPEYRLKSLSYLNTNLKTIQTLCSSSHQFDYAPLKLASNSTLDTLAHKYSSNAMLQIPQIQETIKVASNIFDSEETDTIRHRFHGLVSADINRFFVKMQEISQAQDLCVSDVNMLEKYKWGVEGLKESPFSSEYAKISELFKVCASKMEQHKKIQEEKKARQEAISLKARSLILYLDRFSPGSFLNSPLLIKIMANHKPNEITSEKKLEIEEILKSPDLENELKFRLSNLYDAYLKEFTD